MADFRLIETMRVSENGEVFLLERHLARLSRSAKFFSFKCDVEEIRRAIPRDAKAIAVRLLLPENGAFTLERQPLPRERATRLKLSSVRVNSSDVFLYHKTTNRGVYEEARRECDAQTDVILVNERGEITETTIMNIAVRRGDRWITPAVSCGLLAGVMREELLSRGEISEGIILANELRDGEVIRCFNALRGIFQVRFEGG